MEQITNAKVDPRCTQYQPKILPFKKCSSTISILKKLGIEFNTQNETPKPFNKVLLVGIQHILGTTVDMLKVMKSFGLSDAIIGGKFYSTHIGSSNKISKLGFDYVSSQSQVGYGRFNYSINQLACKIWERALEKIEQKKYDLLIILDDGADLLLNTPGKLFEKVKSNPDLVIGVEQTNGGANRTSFHSLPFPIINVAGSYVKQVTEYPYVADAVINKAFELVNGIAKKKVNKQHVIGVVGYGILGKSLCKTLENHDFSINVFDPNKESKFVDHNFTSTLNELIEKSDIIFSCAGKDITTSSSTISTILKSSKKKWLVNAASKDTDFNTLLLYVQNKTKTAGFIPDPLSNIEFINDKGVTINILRGGFPINFDNKKHCIPPKHIWPTRAALLLAMLDASRLRYRNFDSIRQSTAILQLDLRAQMLIFKRYFELNHIKENVTHLNFDLQSLIDLILSRSKGDCLENPQHTPLAIN